MHYTHKIIGCLTHYVQVTPKFCTFVKTSMSNVNAMKESTQSCFCSLPQGNSEAEFLAPGRHTTN